MPNRPDRQAVPRSGGAARHDRRSHREFTAGTLAGGQHDARLAKSSRSSPKGAQTILERGADVGQNPLTLASTGHQQKWQDGL